MFYIYVLGALACQVTYVWYGSFSTTLCLSKYLITKVVAALEYHKAFRVSIAQIPFLRRRQVELESKQLSSNDVDG